MIGVKRFKVDDGSSGNSVSTGSFGSGGSLANGVLEISANSALTSGVNFHAQNAAPTSDCALLCLNGTSGQHYTGDFAILSQSLNVVGSNSETGTTAVINMYGATDTIGSQDAQIVCSGGNSSTTNNGTLAIRSLNFNVDSTGVLRCGGVVGTSGTRNTRVITVNNVVDDLAMYLVSNWGSIVMAPCVSTTVYSTICQNQDSFIGYYPASGGNGLVLAPWNATGTTGLRLDSSGNTTVNGTLTVTANTTLRGTLSTTGNTTLSGTLSTTGNTTLSGTLNVTGNTTLSGTLSATGNTTLSGTLTLGTPTPPFSGVITVTVPQAAYVANNFVQALNFNYPTATPTNGTTYLNYKALLLNGYGGLWGSGSVFGTATISNWCLQFSNTNPSTIKEAMRLYAPNANTIYIGVNNATPANTLDIVNVASGVNALNIKNAAGTSTILSVTDAGNTSIAGTLSAANTSLSGTLSVSGNTTLNGSLTQSVGGSTKFSVDTSGNQYTAGYWTCGTTTRFSTSAQTIQASAINSPAISASNSIGQVLLVPYCGVTGFNSNTQLNDAGLFYSMTNSQGFVLGPWASSGAGNCIRLDSNGNTQVTGTLTTSGTLALGATGTSIAVTIGGSSFSADTVKAALNNMSTPTYSANLTLTSTYVAPTSTQLGYTVNLTVTGLTLSTYNVNSQNICGTSGTGRNITVSVGGSYIVTWNYTVTPSNASNPSYIYISTTEATASADSLYASRVWFPTGDSVAKSGVLTRLYSGAACTFSPICFLGNYNGSSINLKY